MTYYTTIKTTGVGELLLTANETHLTALHFLKEGELEKLPVDWKRDPKHPALRQARTEVEEYLKGARKEFSALLHFEGTKFQKAVWRQIARIPFGETITYSELAQRAGNAKAVRAAGTATGRNPIAIIVPCHRVVGKHGALGGFAGGLDRKRHLLRIEGDAGKR